MKLYPRGVGAAYDPNRNPFEQVFGKLGEIAGTGAEQTGVVADWLISAGLSAAAIRQILNGVATSADASPEIIRAAQTQARFAELYDAQLNPRQNWIVPALIVGAVVYFATRKK